MSKIFVKSNVIFFDGHWYITSGDLKKMFGRWCQDRNTKVVYSIDDINDYRGNHIIRRCGMSYANKNCDMIIATNNARIQSLKLDEELRLFIKMGGSKILSEIKKNQEDGSWIPCHNYKFELSWTTPELKAHFGDLKHVMKI